MRVDSNPPVSVSRPLAVQNHNPDPHGCLFGRDTLIGGFESTCAPQMPLVEIFTPVMLRKLIAFFEKLWYFRGKKLNSLASVPA